MDGAMKKRDLQKKSNKNQSERVIIEMNWLIEKENLLSGFMQYSQMPHCTLIGLTKVQQVANGGFLLISTD